MKVETVVEKAKIPSYSCSNPNCKKVFDKPKLIQYLACPHCDTRIEQTKSCQHWYGYLSQREKGIQIPEECIECDKSLECLLGQCYESPKAVTEIKKWY